MGAPIDPGLHGGRSGVGALLDSSWFDASSARPARLLLPPHPAQTLCNHRQQHHYHEPLHGTYYVPGKAVRVLHTLRQFMLTHIIIVPMLQTRGTPEHREVTELAPSHTASEKQNGDSNPGRLAPEPMLPSTHLAV